MHFYQLVSSFLFMVKALALRICMPHPKQHGSRWKLAILDYVRHFG
jgi:hypothetical protein